MNRPHFLALLTFAACTGDIVTPISRGGPIDPVTGEQPLDCSGPQPMRVPTQRLNRRQVAAVWSDLFGASLPDVFPATERSDGYSTFPEANVVQDTGVTGMLEASEALAMQLADTLPACTAGASGEAACARTELSTLASRAFRRPATTEELDLLMRVYTAARGDSTFTYREGVALSIEALVQMPAALYLIEPTLGPGTLTLDANQLAARMGALFTLGLPDEALRAAAADGTLLEKQTRREQATRLLATERGRRAVTQFVREWLGLEGFVATSTQFSAAVQAALEEELFRLVSDALAHGEQGFAQLMTSRRAYVNAALEQFYGLPVEAKGSDGWRVAEVESRVGLLTHPLVMARTAHGADPSLILRGRFVRTALLCTDMPPPPAGAIEMQPVLPAGSTSRDASRARMSVEACGACHKLMDPIGYAFLAYDGVGRPVAGEDGKGEILAGGELTGGFASVRALGEKLAVSQQAQRCFARQWLRYAAGRRDGSADACAVQQLSEPFQAASGDLEVLFTQLPALDAFSLRQGEAP